MPASHSLAHRRALAALLRREPQTGFDPTAIFGAPLPDISSIFPNLPIPGLPGGIGGGGPGGDTTPVPPTSAPLPGVSSTLSLPSTTLASSTESTSSTPALPTTTAVVAPPPVVNTTPTTNIVTGQPQTTIVTRSQPSTTSGSSTATSSSTTVASGNDASGGMSTGAVVGGIGAGIVAIAAIGFAAAYFVRRAKRKEATEDIFDPSSFRRSAVLLNDPRPPSMIENRAGGNASAPNYGGAPSAYAPSEYAYPDNNAGYGAPPSHFQSFAPGQVMGPGGYPQQQQSPFTPSTPHGYYNEAEYYSQVPPMTNGAPGMGMVGTYPVLTRQPSAGAPYAQYPHDQGQGYNNQQMQMGHDLLPPEPLPAGDYVDLARSSVSPYQAQQYAEISRRLNTDVPVGQEGQQQQHQQQQYNAETDRDLPPVPPKTDAEAADPFASAPPSPAPTMPATAFVNPHDKTAGSGRVSQESYRAPSAAHDMEFPIPPPSPVLSVSRYGGAGAARVESMPPVLNLNLENRPMSFGVGVVGAGTAAVQVVPMPKSGSPLAQSQLSQQSQQQPQQQQQQQERDDAKKRALSVYDPEDAYGGF